MLAKTKRLYDAADKIKAALRAQGKEIGFLPMGGADPDTCGSVVGYFDPLTDRYPNENIFDRTPDLILAGPNGDGTFGVLAPTDLQRECFLALGQKWNEPSATAD